MPGNNKKSILTEQTQNQIRLSVINLLLHNEIFKFYIIFPSRWTILFYT